MVAAIALVTGCARTTVKPRFQTTAAGLARPNNVYVLDFAVSAAQVAEDQNLLSGAVASARGKTGAHRRKDIAEQIVDRLADDMVDGIRKLGLPAKRVPRGPLPPGCVVVSGRFLKVDEGNQLRRLVIGFGAGQSSLDTQVQLHGMLSGRFQVLQEFTPHADSGAMPGAAVTMGAGAAAQGGATAGMAAANAAATGVKAYRSSVEQAAARTADQAVAELSQFFARQGWIGAGQAKEPSR